MDSTASASTARGLKSDPTVVVVSPWLLRHEQSDLDLVAA
jgi:hypothetical protein